ncbi:MAG: aminoglycoside phosphotransferase family protein [Parcubacteria group bacterium]
MDKINQPLRLSLSNVGKYLIQQKRRLPFRVRSIRTIEEVAEYSNNNYLFEIATSSGDKKKRYYLKQAQKYNKRSVEEKKPIFIHPARILGEIHLIKRLEKLWGRTVVPRVFFSDATNYVFLMSDVKGTGKYLIYEFAKNRVHPKIGKTLGRYLGKLHATSYCPRGMCGVDPNYQRFMLRFFYNKHWGHGVRKFFPPHAVGTFYRKVTRVPSSIIWGDPVYRNIFVHSQERISCIDFDHAVLYDSMHDLGVLVAHWVWMWVKGNKKVKHDSEKFLTSCTVSYWRQWKKQPKLTLGEQTAMRERLLKWIGIYLLSRTDGRSGSYFKPWPAWEKRIRQLGIQLFKGEKNALTIKLRHLLSIV